MVHLGMVGNICFLGLFGLAQSYTSALGFRLAQGLASGNIPVIKTYIVDITDATNESRAFAYVGIVFGIGVILGPELGGFLVNPAKTYPSVFGSSEFLRAYPYFLPVGVIAAKIAIDFVFAVLFLPESVRKKPLTPVLELTDPNPENRWSVVKRVLLCENFRTTCMIHVLVGSILISFWELLPVYAKTGVGLSPSDIGLLQSASGIFFIFCSFFLYCRLAKLYGGVKLYQAGIRTMQFAAPIPIIVAGLGVSRDDNTTWVLLGASAILYALAANLCFTTCTCYQLIVCLLSLFNETLDTIMLKSSVPTQYAGLGLGLGQSIGNIGHAIGPACGGLLYSYFASLKYIPAPLGDGLMFFVLLEGLLLFAMRSTQQFSPWPWPVPTRL